MLAAAIADGLKTNSIGTTIGRDFTNQDLTNARMYDSNFAVADFVGANLTNASLRDSILTGADLRGANLTNAVLNSNPFIFDNAIALPGGPSVCDTSALNETDNPQPTTHRMSSRLDGSVRHSDWVR